MPKDPATELAVLSNEVKFLSLRVRRAEQELKSLTVVTVVHLVVTFGLIAGVGCLATGVLQ